MKELLEFDTNELTWLGCVCMIILFSVYYKITDLINMFLIYVRSDEYITLSKEERNKVVDVYVNAKCVLNNTLRQLQRRQRELYDNRP